MTGVLKVHISTEGSDLPFSLCVKIAVKADKIWAPFSLFCARKYFVASHEEWIMLLKWLSLSLRSESSLL